MISEDISFERSIRIAEKKAFSTTLHNDYLLADIIRFSKYIRKIKKNENSNISNDELQEKLLDDFYKNLAPIVFEAGFSFENYMDLNSCKYLQTSNNFSELLDIVSQDEYVPPITNETFDDYLESYVSYLYTQRHDIYSTVTTDFDSNMMGMLKGKNFLINDDKDTAQETYKKLEKYIRTNFSQRGIQLKLLENARVACFGLKQYLKIDEELLKGELREDLTNSIVSITSSLDSLGSYSRYEKLNLKNLNKFGFSSMQVSNSNDNLYVSLQDLPKYLDMLNIDDLMILNTFWLNRYTKELDCYADCLSAIREDKSLLPQILSYSHLDKSTISQEQHEAIAIKKALLRPFITDFLIKKQAEINSTGDQIDLSFENVPSENNKYVTFSYEPLKEYVSDSDFYDSYVSYFNSFTPDGNNNPYDDIVFYGKLFNPSISAYSQKSDYLSALITNIESNKEIVNSGLIPDSFSKDGTHVNLSRFVGLGIDTKLTFPVREHLSLDFLKNFLISYTGSSMIPLYEGIDDFKDPKTNSLVSAQLVLPFSTKQIDYLKKVNKSKQYPENSKNFVQHLYFLSNPKKVPDSMLTKTYSPSGKEKNVFLKRYVDLETRSNLYNK